jgi:Chlamydia CHLPS protein (DUF818)
MSLESISFPNQNAIVREDNYNPPKTTSFQNILDGPNAFYKQIDYVAATKRDLSQKKPLSVSYTWNTEHKVIRIVKQIFSVIIFPVGIYKLLHALAGKVALLPASSPSLIKIPKNHADESRSSISLEGDWKYKRITVEVDGYKIDAMIVGQAATLNNGRWVLASNGNGEFYEDKLSGNLQHILGAVYANAIVFNYPGVGASSGLPGREAMTKAFRALLTFLEDKKNGIGAEEIIAYGHSIGGGVQGDALKAHELKKDVKYVFVKSRTFSNLSTEASLGFAKPFGFLVKILGWNMDSVESSKKLKAPEIILQTANVVGYEELKDSSKIIDDGVIPAKASLAKALLEDDKCPKENKIFIGMQEGHNSGVYDPSFLAGKINALLNPFLDFSTNDDLGWEAV